MPWIQPANWSRSRRRPSPGSSTTRIATPAIKRPASAAISVGDQRSPATPAVIGSDAAGCPVALGRSIHATQLGHRPAVRPGRVGHGAGVVEEPLDLALVQVDAHDLALELVGD